MYGTGKKKDINSKINKFIAESKYQEVLENIIYPIVGKRETLGDDLKKAGMKFFGKKLTGVFPSDMIPILNKDKPYAIINLDTHDMPGSHWIALAHMSSGKIMVYDSFGRPTKDIISSAIEKFGINKLVQTEDDAEQDISEDDCGARTLAFLFIFDRYGENIAKWI